MNILECSKTILSKVSFDAELLEKEPGKTIGNITMMRNRGEINKEESEEEKNT